MLHFTKIFVVLAIMAAFVAAAASTDISEHCGLVNEMIAKGQSGIYATCSYLDFVDLTISGERGF